MEYLVPALITAVATIVAAVLTKSRTPQIIIQNSPNDSKSKAAQIKNDGSNTSFFIIFFIIAILGISAFFGVSAIVDDTSDSASERVVYSLSPQLHYDNHICRKFPTLENIPLRLRDTFTLIDYTQDPNDEVICLYVNLKRELTQRFLLVTQEFPVGQVKGILSHHSICRIKRIQGYWVILYEQSTKKQERILLLDASSKEAQEHVNNGFRVEHLVKDSNLGYIYIMEYNEEGVDWWSAAQSEFPQEQIAERWEENIDLHRLEFSNQKWTIIASNLIHPDRNIAESYVARSSFPANEIFISEQKGFMIRNINFVDGKWFIHYWLENNNTWCE